MEANSLQICSLAWSAKCVCKSSHSVVYSFSFVELFSVSHWLDDGVSDDVWHAFIYSVNMHKRTVTERNTLVSDSGRGRDLNLKVELYIRSDSDCIIVPIWFIYLFFNTVLLYENISVTFSLCENVTNIDC